MIYTRWVSRSVCMIAWRPWNEASGARLLVGQLHAVVGRHSFHLSMKFCWAMLLTAQATAAALLLLTEGASLLKCRERSAEGEGATR